MSELGIFSTFNNSDLGCSLTTFKVNDDIWLIGTEFATALEYENPRKAIRDHVDESDKFYFQDFNFPRNETFRRLWERPQTILISEAGAYCLILRSKLPAAKELTKWFTKEVLTTLRKTGTYTIPEGALPKLKDINTRDVYNLCGSERREFKGKINEMQELLKSNVAVQRGKRGGKVTQERIREVKNGNKTLRSQTLKLRNENLQLANQIETLEDQIEELTNELGETKFQLDEILEDDY